MPSRVRSREVCMAGGYSTQGLRPYMEDYHSLKEVVTAGGERVGLYGVYDGHGGEAVAEYVCGRFVELVTGHPGFEDGTSMAGVLRDAVTSMETEVVAWARERGIMAGTTLCFLVVRAGRLYCANVGDSRAVLAGAAGAAIALSQDHVPWRADERRRIVAAGGWVDEGGVNGVMTVSRSLGDLDMKELKHRSFPGKELTDSFFIADPEVSVTRLNRDHDFVLIASDGLWGRVPSRTAVNYVLKSLHRDGQVEKACYKLTSCALRAGAEDNITVLLLLLNPALLQSSSTHGGSLFRRRNNARQAAAAASQLSTSLPTSVGDAVLNDVPDSAARKADKADKADRLARPPVAPHGLRRGFGRSGSIRPSNGSSAKSSLRDLLSPKRRLFSSSSSQELSPEAEVGFVGNSDPTGTRSGGLGAIFRRRALRKGVFSKIGAQGPKEAVTSSSAAEPSKTSSNTKESSEEPCATPGEKEGTKEEGSAPEETASEQSAVSSRSDSVCPVKILVEVGG